MANYTKATDFAAKDGLTSGDPAKIVKGAEIDDEFNAIVTAVNSKANTNSPALTGIPTAPTAVLGTSNSQLATTAFVQANVSGAYPIGSIYINASVATNPADLFGFGTWEAFGTGRVLVGVDSGDTAFDTLGETGGSKTSANTSTSAGDHSHTVAYTSWGTQGGAPGSITSGALVVGSGASEINEALESIRKAGGDKTTSSVSAHTHSVTSSTVQPYITVYMWKRTA